MTDLLIRGLDPEAHRELERRAELGPVTGVSGSDAVAAARDELR